MPYGEIRVDTITFTNGGLDTSITVSGLAASTTGNLTVTGTVSGTNANFVSGTFSTRVSGLTVAGTTGTFNSITGGVATITSGIFASGTAANPSVTFVGDLDNGIYSPAANQVSIATSGTERLRLDETGQIEAVSLGTAAAPTFTWTTDPDTGLYSPGGNQIAFSTNATERFRVDSSGRLLLNISTARSNVDTLTPQLQVESTTEGGSTISITRNVNNAGCSFLYLNKTRGSAVGQNTIVQSGDIISIVNFGAADGTNIIPAASISSVVDGTPGANDMPGRLVFSTTADGSAVPTERLRIDSAGQIEAGVGGSASVPTYSWLSDTDTGIYNPGANQLALTTGGTGRVFIDSAGRIGIGTNSPESYSASFNNLVLSTATNCGMTIVSGTAGSGTVGFADGTVGNEAFRGYVQYQHSADALLLGTLGTERLRIDSSGRVGIGTSTPEWNLDVRGTNPRIQIRQSSATDLSLFQTVDNANNSFYIGADNSTGSNFAQGNYARVIYSQGTAPLRFSTNSTLAMTIDSSGRVGIGVSAPQRLLHLSTSDNVPLYVQTTNANCYLQLQNNTGLYYIRTTGNNLIFESNLGEAGRWDVNGKLLVGTSTDFDGYLNQISSSSGTLLSLRRTNSNPGSIKLTSGASGDNVASGSNLGYLRWYGFHTSTDYEAARISGEVDATPGANDMPGRLVFSTTADGSASPTERLRIDSSGQIQAASLGTAATPVLTFLNDNNTGVFSSGADRLSITTSGVEKIRIDDFDGNPIVETSFPNIRPSLDLNFAATKRLDPRVTFSRSSSGTYFDANGVLQSAATNVARFDHNPTTGESLGLLVEEARTNELTYSQRTGTGWTTTNLNSSLRHNSDVAPDGTFTATAWIENSGAATHDIVIAAANTGRRTYTAFVKEITGSSKRYLALGLQYGGDIQYRIFDASGDGAVSAQILGSRTLHLGGTIGTIQKLLNGWYRCTVTWTGTNTDLGEIHIQIVNNFTGNSAGSNGLVSYAGDGTSGLLLWGIQLETGSFPTSYIPTPATFTSRSSTATFYDSAGVIQTAASGVDRSNAFLPDSNGVFRPAGLLLEAEATNLLTRSQEFDTSPWSTAGLGGVVTTNADTAPDGTLTADRVSDKRLERNDISYTANTTYTFSLFVKGTAGQTLGIGRLVAGSDGDVVLSYTTLNGTWQRLSYTFTSPITASSSRVVISGANDKSGTATNFLVWGAQLEASPYATSYIPTTTATATRAADTSTSATVTRSADVAQITGTNFSSWYRPDEGTIYCRNQSAKPTGSSYGAYVISDNTSSNRILHANNANTGSSACDLAVVTRAVEQVNFRPLASTVVNTFYSTAFAYRQNDFAGSANGGNVVVDASGTVPSVNRLDLGFFFPGASASNILNGTISRFSYWPARLSNANLQAITS